MPSMRLPGRRGAAPAQPPMQYPPMITCPVCGLRNDISLRFCRNCGLPLGAPRDPVRGTTTKRAELPSDRGTGVAALVGLVAVVLVAGGAGFMVYRGFQARADSGAPGASHIAAASVAPTSTPGPASPGASAAPGSSVAPSVPVVVLQTPGPDQTPDVTNPPATQGPADTPEPGPTPTPRATPAALGTRMSWTCKPTGIQDPTKGRWRISRASWSPGSTTDRLTLTLTRVSGSTKSGTIIGAAFMPTAKAASTYHITRPNGDRAVVLTFDGPITVGTSMAASPAMRVIETIDVRRGADGVTHAVIGVTGSGCIRLDAPDWANGDPALTTAALVLDVRR